MLQAYVSFDVSLQKQKLTTNLQHRIMLDIFTHNPYKVHLKDNTLSDDQIYYILSTEEQNEIMGNSTIDEYNLFGLTHDFYDMLFNDNRYQLERDIIYKDGTITTNNVIGILMKNYRNLKFDRMYDVSRCKSVELNVNNISFRMKSDKNTIYIFDYM